MYLLSQCWSNEFLQHAKIFFRLSWKTSEIFKISIKKPDVSSILVATPQKKSCPTLQRTKKPNKISRSFFEIISN